MRTRAFGKTDLRVSEFGLGCARIGGIFQADTAGFLDLLRAAWDTGINFFDTADMYSQGESESLIGRAFRGQRDRVIIASKAGYRLPTRRMVAARLKPFLRPAIRILRLRRERLSSAARGSPTQDFSADYLRQAVEGSLRRLRTDYLDLFQLHSPPADVVERGEWQGTLEALQRAGKIRYYGVSCDTTEAGLAALRYSGVSSVQFVLNLLDQGATDTLLPAMREAGVAGVARECLANGLLAKKAEQIDLGAYCRSEDERKLREEELVRYRTLAAGRGCSLTEMALRYVTDAKGVCVTLVGARTREQLQGLLCDINKGRPAAELS